MIALSHMRKFVFYCTVFALFYFKFDGNFQLQDPEGLYLDGRFNGGFFALRVRGGFYLEGLMHGGAYFRNFTVIILACPGFEPTHLCDPSDQMRPLVEGLADCAIATQGNLRYV